MAKLEAILLACSITGLSYIPRLDVPTKQKSATTHNPSTDTPDEMGGATGDDKCDMTSGQLVQPQAYRVSGMSFCSLPGSRYRVVDR